MKKKLTVDVFAETDVFDGKRCPAWAKYAAVDADGTLYLYGNEPSLEPSAGEWDYYEGDNHWCWWNDGYDASDWKNSLIKRPETKEERKETTMTNYERIKQMSEDDLVAFLADTDDTCDFCADKGKACGSCYDGIRRWLNSPVKPDDSYPEWAKPGAWVYNKELKEYVHIGSITGDEVSFMDGTYGAVSKETFLQDYVEVTYRPYNHDELMNLVGEKLELPDAICLVTVAHKDSDYIIVDSLAYTANQLLSSNHRYKGNKCGVLVHKDGDEWVD